MSNKAIIDTLKQRLKAPLPGLSAQERMAVRVVPMPAAIPANARDSAVLCLIYPVENKLCVLLMQRNTDKSAHSGQISFPGGRYETSDESLQATALRETYEEVGIPAIDIQVLGALTPLYIPVSNFMVHPFVAYANNRPAYTLNKNEVVQIIEIRVEELFHHSRKTLVDVTSPAVPDVLRQVKAYQLEDGTIIWGATAMILSELEVVMEESKY
ncbi:MAG: CoA pyrophosphatase [Taibaiella sp.]|nr:CoA pyrophosphatase [Taibaiella sp.]